MHCVQNPQNATPVHSNLIDSNDPALLTCWPDEDEPRAQQSVGSNGAGQYDGSRNAGGIGSAAAGTPRCDRARNV